MPLTPGGHRAAQLLIAGAFAVAAFAVPAVTQSTSTAPMATCPAGMIADPISGRCSSQPQNVKQVPVPENGLSTVDGIPCTGHNTGECIGLTQNQH